MRKHNIFAFLERFIECLTEENEKLKIYVIVEGISLSLHVVFENVLLKFIYRGQMLHLMEVKTNKKTQKTILKCTLNDAMLDTKLNLEIK